jgi:hypothetical protein
MFSFETTFLGDAARRALQALELGISQKIIRAVTSNEYKYAFAVTSLYYESFLRAHAKHTSGKI